MRWSFLLALVACTGKDDEGPGDETEGVGLMGDEAINPFPSWDMVQDGHLALAPLTPMEGGTPLPVEAMAWRTGFSPGQTTVFYLEEVDAAALPSWRTFEPEGASVRLVDLTAGVDLPVFAELDAWPDDNDQPALLVRPQVAMALGHTIAAVVTTAAAARPERFERLINGDAPLELADQVDHYTDLIAQLEAHGIPADEVAIAVDFPIGDGAEPLRSALSQVGAPGSYTLDVVRDADNGDTVPPHTWRNAQGHFDVPNFLEGDTHLRRDGSGSVAEGTASAELWIHIPESVADAPAGTVPVMIFGHGILSMPENYLGRSDDTSEVLLTADRAGYIVLATTWRGLTWKDRDEAIGAAGDFGELPLVPERLIQAQVNTRSMIDLALDGGLLDHEMFKGRDGQALVNKDHLVYYGISLGGIEGTVLLANEPRIDGAVLHVAGSTWSTMLERSSNWPAFEILVTDTIPDPKLRQRLYAMSQLWWDPVDPISWTGDLGDRRFLLHESIGDEQVPNMTTRALARSIGLFQLGPVVDAPYGIPLGEGMVDRAYVQFDPEQGLPAEVNRPAPKSGAHDYPRRWDGTQSQITQFLGQESSGTIGHFCGEGPCAFNNQGTWVP